MEQSINRLVAEEGFSQLDKMMKDKQMQRWKTGK